jgi:RimJ/RimL family protein N-acetyltransferase
MAVKYYEGERIYFRPFELSDETLLRKWVNDPRNWRTLARSSPVNELREREFIEKLYTAGDEVALGVVVREDDRLIGAAALRGIGLPNRSASFGILIGDVEFQSQGYGTEATELMLKLGFEEYNLNRIELDVFSSNPGGIRAYEKAGFVLEGRLREAHFKGGHYVDVLKYSVLRWEWAQSRRTEHASIQECSAASVAAA